MVHQSEGFRSGSMTPSFPKVENRDASAFLASTIKSMPGTFLSFSHFL